MNFFYIVWLFFASVFLIFVPNSALNNDTKNYVPSAFIARVSSFFANSFYSNMLWIGSVNEGEFKNGTGFIDANMFYNRFKTISILDSDFFEPIQYGSLFLATVSKKPEYAINILTLAQKNAQDKNRLLELELLERVCYEKPINLDRINTMQIVERDRFLTSKELIEYANNKAISEEVTKENLEFLSQKAKNEAQKSAIKNSTY